MDSSILIRNITQRCREKSIPPTVACDRSGAGKDFITNLRRGQKPSVEKVQMMAEFLDCTTSDLLGEKKEPTIVSDDGPDLELWELLKRIPAERMPEVERYLRFQAEQQEKP